MTQRPIYPFWKTKKYPTLPEPSTSKNSGHFCLQPLPQGRILPSPCHGCLGSTKDQERSITIPQIEYFTTCFGRNITASATGEAHISSFMCASDDSFAHNTLDRKSSQGYIMKRFGRAVAWRANKQDTVTTSSTEAELLAILQTAKETIYLSRLRRALTLVLQ